MPKRILGLSLSSILMSGGAVMALAAAALFGASSENLLRSSFGSALHTAAIDIQSRGLGPKTVPMAGSEEFWLSALQHDGPAPLTKTVAVGDRITMTLGGIERHFEIANVAEFEPKFTAVNTTPDATRFVLITARDTRDATARPVRFAVEIQPGALPGNGMKTARAL